MHGWGKTGWWHFSFWALFFSCFACVSGGAATAWLLGPNDWKKMSDSGHAKPDPRQQKTCDLPPICLNQMISKSMVILHGLLCRLSRVTQWALSCKNNLCSSKAEEKGVTLIQNGGVSRGSASVALHVICDSCHIEKGLLSLKCACFSPFYLIDAIVEVLCNLSASWLQWPGALVPQYCWARLLVCCGTAYNSRQPPTQQWRCLNLVVNSQNTEIFGHKQH